jgi:uncharacterized membrane-anchored protein
MIQYLDRLFGSLLLLGSLLHSYGSISSYRFGSQELVWALSGSLAGGFISVLNLIRSGRPEDLTLAWIAFAGSLSWVAVAVSFGLAVGNLFDPRVLWHAISALVLIGLVVAQIVAKKFHPSLYWATIVASTTFGTTMADFADRSLGIGYTGGSTLLFACLLITLGLWYWSLGSISVATVNTPKVEAFYWAAITFSQTLGTALGDWMADSTSLGYMGGAVVFGIAIAIVAAVYNWTNISRVGLFWVAFILTRPLGATVGDFLDKPLNHGGLALSRPIASAIIAIFIVGCILLLPQKAGTHPGQPKTVSR